MRSLFIISLALFTFTLSAQTTLKQLHPVSFQNFAFHYEEGLQHEAVDVKVDSIILKEIRSGRDFDSLSLAEGLTAHELSLYNKYIDRVSYFYLLEPGCSWYCLAADNDSVSASSTLKNFDNITFAPQQAHDINAKNAWAEGVPGYGIGQYLLYQFQPTLPPINKVKILNGFAASSEKWNDYSRVKKLKVSYNGKAIAILHLEDTRDQQTFHIPQVGYPEEAFKKYYILETKPNWTLKFEIMDVYKGAKYDHTVVSEIYFEGVFFEH